MALIPCGAYWEDAAAFVGSLPAHGHLHMRLVVGVRVVLGPLGQLLADDVLVQGQAACPHFALHLQASTMA